jgi:hypothetical protein
MTLKVPKHTGQKSHTTTSGLRRLEVNQVFEKSALKEGEHILTFLFDTPIINLTSFFIIAYFTMTDPF